MKSHRLLGAIVITLLILSVFSFQVAAQQNMRRHHRYKMIEIGTFGGPDSVYNVLSRIATNDGAVVGAANTSVPDPTCFDGDKCFVLHAWKWQNGVLKDLGVLPGG